MRLRLFCSGIVLIAIVTGAGRWFAALSERSRSERASWPLIDASYSGDIDTVRRLLTAGVDPNRADATGWTPLHWAAGRGHVEITRVLLSHGADPNCAGRFGEASVFSNNIEPRQLRAEYQRMLNNTWDAPLLVQRETPIMLAVSRGNAQIVLILIDHGADVNATDTVANTVLDRAIEQRGAATIRRLRKAGAKESIQPSIPSQD